MVQQQEPVILVFDVDDKGKVALKGINTNLDKFKENLGGSEKQGNKFDRVMGKITAGLGKLKKSIFNFRNLAIAGVFAGIVGGLVSIASEAEETAAKFDVVFGEFAASTRKWSEEFSEATGRARKDVQAWAAGIQDMLIPMGVMREEAAEMSMGLVELAVDVASFQNKLDADVLKSFLSALIGNTEAVRSLGIGILESDVTAEAFRAGLIKNKSELNTQIKLLARLNLLYANTEDAQGDVARTADSFANRLKFLRGTIMNIVEEIGTGLIPIFSELLGLINDELKDTGKKAALIRTVQLFVLDIVSGGLRVLETITPLIGKALNVAGTVQRQLNLMPPEVREAGLIGAALFGTKGVAGLAGSLKLKELIDAFTFNIWVDFFAMPQIKGFEQDLARANKELERLKRHSEAGVPGLEDSIQRVTENANLARVSIIALNDFIIKSKKEFIVGGPGTGVTLGGADIEDTTKKITDALKQLQAVRDDLLAGTGDKGAVADAVSGTGDKGKAALATAQTQLETITGDLTKVSARYREIQALGQLWVQTGLLTQVQLLDLATDANIDMLNLQLQQVQAQLDMSTSAEKTLKLEQQKAEIIEELKLAPRINDLKTMQAIEQEITAEMDKQIELINAKTEATRAQFDVIFEAIDRASAATSGGPLGGFNQAIFDVIGGEVAKGEQVVGLGDRNEALDKEIQNRREVLSLRQSAFDAEALELDQMVQFKDIQDEIFTKQQEQTENIKKQQELLATDVTGAWINALGILGQAFDGMAEIMAQAFGRGSAAAKTFAALSIITNTAMAIVATLAAYAQLAANPVANLFGLGVPAIEAAGMAQVAFITAVGAAQLGIALSSFHEGGIVGPGGKRETPVLALEDELFVNEGGATRILAGLAAGGGGGAGGGQPIVNVLDSSIFDVWAASPNGRRAIVNVMNEESLEGGGFS